MLQPTESQESEQREREGGRETNEIDSSRDGCFNEGAHLEGANSCEPQGWVVVAWVAPALFSCLAFHNSFHFIPWANKHASVLTPTP